MSTGDELPGLPHQIALWSDTTSPFIVMPAGYGSGKTFGVIIKSLLLAYANWPIAGIVVEPDFPLVRRVLLRDYARFFRSHGIRHRWRERDHVMEVDLDFGEGSRTCEILLEGADPPERLVGANLSYAIIDEAGLQKEEVRDRLFPRVRAPGARQRQIVIVGTPEGHNWFHEVAEAKPPPGSRLIRASTLDNLFLPGGPQQYVDVQLAHLDDDERQQYVRGHFIAKGGRVYRQFGRDFNVRPCMNPMAGEIVIGCDFNVGKMHWIVGRVLGDELHVWGELVGRQTNTFDHARELLHYLDRRVNDGLAEHDPRREHPRDIARRCLVYCDASGGHRKTAASSTSASDTAILRETGFVHVLHPAANPPVEDRVASVNDRFRRHAIFIDPQGAPDLLRCVEQQGRDKGGQPEKHKDPEKDMSAGPDALGYIVWTRPGWRVTTLKGNARDYRA